jgi:F-type H+-transporting ATPase subunit b
MIFASSSSGNGGDFLIPNGTFVVELVMFLIVLGVIAIWILPPLQNVTEARRTRIRTVLQRAEEARSEARSALAERDAILAEARGQARSIVDSASQGAEASVEQARKTGQEEYARLVEEARREIAAECQGAREELIGRLDALVVAAAERILEGEVDVARHRDLIDEAVAAATGDSTSGGAA